MENLRSQVEKMEKELQKSLGFQLESLSKVLKTTEVLKEKKCRVNKMNATAVLMIDNSVMIKFEDSNNGLKLFNEFKEVK